jgi:hypothetical protein
MTRPALRPLTAATAALVAGAAGAVPATAAGIPSAPLRVAYSRTSQLHPVLMSPVAMPAQVGAIAAHGPGATQAGLAAGNVAVAGDGSSAPAPRGVDRAGGSPAVRVVRARGPPA